MIRYEREVRAIPLWLLGEYLQELGGKIQRFSESANQRMSESAREEVWVAGPGWQAVLRQMEDFQVGSLRIGQVRLEIEAEETAFEALRPALEKKLLRAGG